MTGNQLIKLFVDKIILIGEYTALDKIYLRNKLLDLIGQDNFVDELVTSSEEKQTILELLDQCIQQAITNGKINDLSDEIDPLEGQLMDLITPLPSKVNQEFENYYQDSPEKATNYFYQLSKNNNYIKTREIAKNIHFKTETEYGELEITINLSKPEKDPKKIAESVKQAPKTYPKCLLCIENEGYKGRENYPNRRNHRVIRLEILGEVWGLQYSPYAYYNEHAIIFSNEHTPMTINQKTFQRLIDIVHQFPHYFVGSNADLPIVGGSILTHEHYQAGNHQFPLDRAPVEQTYTHASFPNVVAGIVKWPSSVIRLVGTNKQEVIDLATIILERWQVYDNAKLGIFSRNENGQRSHTVTPIVRKNGPEIIMNLVLRDNSTTSEFPEGVFHPHADVQHIKKENIGLIEIMGLAILPPRLFHELLEVEAYLLGKENNMNPIHFTWADQIDQNYCVNSENIRQIIEKEVGKVFLRVLEDTGVFKRNAEGKEAFHQFMTQIF